MKKVIDCATESYTACRAFNALLVGILSQCQLLRFLLSQWECTSLAWLLWVNILSSAKAAVSRTLVILCSDIQFLNYYKTNKSKGLSKAFAAEHYWLKLANKSSSNSTLACQDWKWWLDVCNINSDFSSSYPLCLMQSDQPELSQ